MKIKIEIAMDNAVFDPCQGIELSRILHELADRVEDGQQFVFQDNDWLRDVNGNTVGQFQFKE